MHSVRRAAFRAASSSLVASASRQQAGSFAMQFAKAARPAVAMPARFFSQTTRVAQEQDHNEQAIVEDAIKSTEDQSTLESSPDASAAAEEAGSPIFVSNMTFDATDIHLREAFGKYGDITSVKIGRDGRGLSRGFGFVTFADKQAAEQAVAECHKSFWHGRRINVEHRKSKDVPERAPRPTSQEPSTSLYIGNIPYETSDADLNRLFRELEGVTDVRVAVDRNTGWPRGFAHADFADIESAIKGHEKVAATSMGGRMLKVDYSQKRSGTGSSGGPRGFGNSGGYGGRERSGDNQRDRRSNNSYERRDRGSNESF